MLLVFVPQLKHLWNSPSVDKFYPCWKFLKYWSEFCLLIRMTEATCDRRRNNIFFEAFSFLFTMRVILSQKLWGFEFHSTRSVVFFHGLDWWVHKCMGSSLVEISLSEFFLGHYLSVMQSFEIFHISLKQIPNSCNYNFFFLSCSLKKSVALEKISILFF